MKLNEYQEVATSTAVYPGQKTLMGILYCALKLNGEAGEVAEKLGKILRDNDGVIDEEKRVLLMKELGDVTWYVANLARELGYSFEEVASENLKKLLDRKARNMIKGSGDER